MTINQKIFGQIPKRMGDKDVKIPPNCFETMDAEFIEFDETNNILIVQFPVKDEYQNPLGLMQGGFIIAAVDNTLGPLSYIVAPPSVTTHLSCTYIRPVKPNEMYITVKGYVIERTSKSLHMKAEVFDSKKKLLVLVQATTLIL